MEDMERQGFRQIIAEQAKVIAEQERTITLLNQKVEVLLAKISELERRLNLNSKNSAKSPSSNGLKNPPVSTRVKGAKKTGGQKGHPGSTLSPVTAPDRIEVHSLDTCAHCLAALSLTPAERWVKRQVWDLIPA